MLARRAVVRRAGRPLVRAAVIGGTAYAAGRAGQRSAQRETDQNEAIAGLQDQQYANQSAYAPAAPAPDMTAQLKQLADLKAAGALSQEEFDAAKRKLLGA
jgi:Short C-terminal domain